MMGSEIIKKIVDIGTDSPYNVVIVKDDKYYEIDDVKFDSEIFEGVIICTEKGNKYSTRSELVNPKYYDNCPYRTESQKRIGRV